MMMVSVPLSKKDLALLRQYYALTYTRERSHIQQFFDLIDQTMKSYKTAAQLNIWDTYNRLDHTAKDKVKGKGNA